MNVPETTNVMMKAFVCHQDDPDIVNTMKIVLMAGYVTKSLGNVFFLDHVKGIETASINDIIVTKIIGVVHFASRNPTVD